MGSTTTASSRRPWRLLGGTAIWLGGAAWLAAVAAGFALLVRYGAEPGTIAAPPARWPTDAPVRLDPRRPTMVLFAHPHCPCTAATLAELERLMASCADRLAVCVMFYADPELGAGWERTGTWKHAATIPGVHLLADPLGKTARAFGAMTSGSAVLYAPDGQLLFHGGITAARGHQGDNAGAAAILDHVTGRSGALRTTEVYGCALVSPVQGRAQ